MTDPRNACVVAAAKALGWAVKPVLRAKEGSGGKHAFGTAFVVELEGQYAAVTAAHVIDGPETKYIGISSSSMTPWPKSAARIRALRDGLADPDIVCGRFTLLPTDHEGARDAVQLSNSMPDYVPGLGMTLLAVGNPVSRGKFQHSEGKHRAGTVYLTGDAVPLAEYEKLQLDPRVHIALHYTRDSMKRPDGSSALGPMPPGMSGGPIFLLTEKPNGDVVLLLVGIMTSYRPGPPELIIGTHVIALLDHLTPFRPRSDRLFGLQG